MSQITNIKEMMESKHGFFINTHNELVTKKEFKQAIKKGLFTQEELDKLEFEIYEAPKIYRENKPHNIECEFAKDPQSCTCWCNNEYHGARLVGAEKRC